MKKLLTLSALGAAVAGFGTADDAHAAKGDKERCYGVVKAGNNDCGANNHSCAGQAETDGDGNEWLYMPKGLCERLVGGSLEPYGDDEDNS